MSKPTPRPWTICAPAMLEALTEIVRIGAIPDTNTEDCRLKRDEMWNIARAAVARAEGRS